MKLLQNTNKVIDTFKPSMFNLFFEIDDKLLVYNTFSGVLLEITQVEREILTNRQIIKNDYNKDLIQEISLRRMIVDYAEDEIKLYKQFIDLLSNSISNLNGYNRYTILPTTACNARCFYCFEGEFKPTNMSLKVAEDIAKFILKTKSSNDISIYWFGGEPLCNTRVIDKISSKLQNSNVNYKSQMITNGYLLTSDMIEKAVSLWNLDFLQFSMDGYGDVHNQRKNFLNPSTDPFLKIIENLDLAVNSDIKTIKVRINIDLKNIESAYKLVDYLKSNYANSGRLSVYATKLFDSSGTWDSLRTNSDNALLHTEYCKLTEYIAKCGLYKYPNLKNKLKLYNCDANKPTAIVIDPVGDLFSCNHCDASQKVGTIYNGITNAELRNAWINNNNMSEGCKDCPFIPTCTLFDKCPDKKSFCRQDNLFLLENAIKSIFKTR